MMLQAITFLLLCQLAGEALVRLLGLAVPGPVIGMVLLFAVLWFRGSAPPALSETAGGILKNLSLLFVPAAVGIIQHAGRIRAEWLAIAAALIVSTLLTMAVAAAAFRLTARLIGADEEQQHTPPEPGL
jgi:holin-like protein